jgi:GNAT superfamily N-acetyltransferase
MSANPMTIRPYRAGDEPGAYHVCMKTGDHGKDGEPFYREDPDALGRIFVGPYLTYEPELSLILEDGEGICGYALGAFDSRRFYERYEKEWRPRLCSQFPEPTGDPSQWSRVQQVHSWYHHPDYYCPEPYDDYPAHLHIDLLERAQGRGFGRRMMEQVMELLRRRGVARGASRGERAEHAGRWVLSASGIPGVDSGGHRDGRLHLHGQALPGIRRARNPVMSDPKQP